MSKDLQPIENRIFTFQDQQVMIDRDLAELYQIETKVLNQAVKRNISRFPDSFRFQLNENDLSELVTNSDRFGHLGFQNVASNSRSQNVTLNNKLGKNIKYRPYAFTEQGVAMLSAVLRSDIAIQVSIQIMNAFIAMRKQLSSNQLIIQRMDRVELKQLESDQKFEQIFKALESKDPAPKQGIFFDGQVFDAHQFVSDLVRKAEKSILLLDNYVDDSVLWLLGKRRAGVKCTIFTKTIPKQLRIDLDKYNAQYPPIQIQEFTKVHDRFLILDVKEIYHIGASIKDLGKRWFAFSKMDAGTVTILQNLKVLGYE
ncbi:ORF6N domain-containing protein [Algoriphagus chordae]|uniref:ORF6N domain-containing protein n=1 Tax=Algoriphagus chordae TaxID=237019 RepID=A0A2W7R0E4_9BACT|nr:ORF6N domain-containing protein [Algoriphagus chordae]PZX53994.1 ORF6N domain-containing protein [Algoriphagus chordae]